MMYRLLKKKHKKEDFDRNLLMTYIKIIKFYLQIKKQIYKLKMMISLIQLQDIHLKIDKF
jgi:hypothetical protein